MSNSNAVSAAIKTLVLMALVTGAVIIGLRMLPEPTVVIPQLANEPGVQVLEHPKPLSDFNLVDHEGQAFTKARLKDHWNIMFFGYTSCPDVCPAALTAMRGVAKALRAKATNPDQVPQFIFVSVDPTRDTTARLKDFVTYFDPEFIAATGETKQAIDQLGEPIGVIYDFEDRESHDLIRDPQLLKPDGDYLVTHYAGIYIVDPKARVTAIVLPPHDVERFVKVYDAVHGFYTR